MIIDVPFHYEVIVRRRRARNPKHMVLFDTLPVYVPEVASSETKIAMWRELEYPPGSGLQHWVAVHHFEGQFFEPASLSKAKGRKDVTDQFVRVGSGVESLSLPTATSLVKLYKQEMQFQELRDSDGEPVRLRLDEDDGIVEVLESNRERVVKTLDDPLFRLIDGVAMRKVAMPVLVASPRGYFGLGRYGPQFSGDNEIYSVDDYEEAVRAHIRLSRDPSNLSFPVQFQIVEPNLLRFDYRRTSLLHCIWDVLQRVRYQDGTLPPSVKTAAGALRQATRASGDSDDLHAALEEFQAVLIDAKDDLMVRDIRHRLKRSTDMRANQEHPHESDEAALAF